jgi:hypothetical protein
VAAVLVLGWGIIESTPPVKRWGYNQITSYNAYNVARQDCLKEGGQVGGGDTGPRLNQIYLPALNGWCTGISEVSWWKLSSLHDTLSSGDQYGQRNRNDPETENAQW